MKQLLTIFLVAALLLPFARGLAQELISSAGATQYSSTLQLSWTVGEPVVETFSAGGSILTQGFHQSSATITALEPFSRSGIEIEAFPNPASELMNLKVKNGNFTRLRFSLFNTSGEQILLRQFSSQVESISLKDLAPGIYVLKVSHNNGMPLQSFQVVKY